MPFTVEYDEERNCILVTCSGDLDLQLVQSTATEVSQMIARTGCPLILNDLQDAQLTRNAFNVYKIPRMMTEVGIGSGVKRALVVGDHQEEFHFLETVFLNYGNDVKTFENVRDAEAWLFG